MPEFSKVLAGIADTGNVEVYSAVPYPADGAGRLRLVSERTAQTRMAILSPPTATAWG